MGDVMAFAAFRELCMDPLRMRKTMAVLAVRYHSVLFLVAEGARECVVLGGAGRECVEGLFVTCSAVRRRYIGGIGHIFRLVRLVAFFAISDNHITGVWLVALCTLRDLAMDVMTHGTVKGGMLALEFPELCDLLSVTGETGVRNIVPEQNI